MFSSKRFHEYGVPPGSDLNTLLTAIRGRIEETNEGIETIIAGAEGRELSADERRQLDELDRQVERCRTHAMDIEMHLGTGAFSRNGGSSGEGAVWRDGRGNEVRLLAPTDKVNDRPLEHRFGPAPVGQVLRALARGDQVPEELRNAVTGSGGGGGHFMLDSELSSEVVDLARSASVVVRAGARTVPMETNELRLVRVLADPTIHARRELERTKASSALFGGYTMTSRMYTAVMPITVEAVEDSANGAEAIEGVARSAMGAAIDRAVLVGAGGKEVLGIVNVEGTNEIANVGTPAAWTDVSQAVGKVLQANYDRGPESLAWVANPRDLGTFDSLVTSTDGQPLQPTPWAAAPTRFSTTSLAPDAGGETQAIVGAFDNVLIGMRAGGVVIDSVVSGEIENEDGTTINAVSDFAIFIRVRVRFDAVLLRPDWFTVLRGITTG